MTIGLNGHQIEAIKDRLMADDLPMRDLGAATTKFIALAIEANNEQLEKDIIQLIRRNES